MKHPARYVALLITVLTLSARAQEVGIYYPNSNFLWTPSLSLGVYYDSNINSTKKNEPGKKDGVGLTISPSLGLGITGNRIELTARGWYTWERGNEDGMDGDYWGEQVSLSKWTEKGWRFMLSESYRRTNNDEFYGGSDTETAYIDSREQESFSLNGAIAKTSASEKTVWTLGGGYSKLRYIGDNRGLSGSESYDFQGQINYQLTGKTDLVGVLTFGADSGDMKEDSYQYTAMAGFSSRIGLAKKFTYRAVAGIGMYEYGGQGGGSNIAPSYSVSAAWAITDKWALSALANSQFTPSDSYQNTMYRWSNAFSLGLNYKPRPKFDFRADVSYRIEDNRVDDSTYSALEYTRSYYAFRLRGNYRITRWMSVYASGSYIMDRYDEAYYGDMDEYRIDAGVQFKY